MNVLECTVSPEQSIHAPSMMSFIPEVCSLPHSFSPNHDNAQNHHAETVVSAARANYDIAHLVHPRADMDTVTRASLPEA